MGSVLIVEPGGDLDRLTVGELFERAARELAAGQAEDPTRPLRIDLYRKVAVNGRETHSRMKITIPFARTP